jgi:malate dehydrogenase (oxaloacetate-decarboxylating)
MPVMEGKALLFKEFGGVDAFPICLDTQAVSEIVETCVRLAPTFGGINLEDISSPRCVEVEEKLTPLVDIPVFHDDQHGTAVVVLAALKNALKVVGKALGGIRVAISGAGAAGIAISRVLGSVGVDDIVVCDRNGAIWQGREGPTNRGKQWVAENTNPRRITGSLGDALVATDVFIGVSAPNVVTPDELKRMANDPIVFAMANPDPEIAPEDALPHVAVMATGRSDYPNQINNVLCFPGVFKGLLDVRARRVTDEMKIAAADAIADVLSDAEVTSDHIIPSVFDRRVVKAVSEAVSKSAIETRVARRPHMPGGLIASHDDTQ